MEDGESYFHAIEDAFVRLRGTPLLLGPTDWQVASGWHRDGVPLDLIVATLEEVFARRHERGARGRINSLRYCANAVAAAWETRQELLATGLRVEPEPPLEVGGRLAVLAASLPSDLADRERWAARILALAGPAPAVEEALAALDAELLAVADAALAATDRDALAAEVEATLAPLRARLDTAAVELARDRLRRGALRRRLGLPLLSLFAVESASERGTPPG